MPSYKFLAASFCTASLTFQSVTAARIPTSAVIVTTTQEHGALATEVTWVAGVAVGVAGIVADLLDLVEKPHKNVAVKPSINSLKVSGTRSNHKPIESKSSKFSKGGPKKNGAEVPGVLGHVLLQPEHRSKKEDENKNMDKVKTRDAAPAAKSSSSSAASAVSRQPTEVQSLITTDAVTAVSGHVEPTEMIDGVVTVAETVRARADAGTTTTSGHANFIPWSWLLGKDPKVFEAEATVLEEKEKEKAKSTVTGTGTVSTATSTTRVVVTTVVTVVRGRKEKALSTATSHAKAATVLEEKEKVVSTVTEALIARRIAAKSTKHVTITTVITVVRGKKEKTSNTARSRAKDRASLEVVTTVRKEKEKAPPKPSIAAAVSAQPMVAKSNKLVTIMTVIAVVGKKTAQALSTVISLAKAQESHTKSQGRVVHASTDSASATSSVDEAINTSTTSASSSSAASASVSSTELAGASSTGSATSPTDSTQPTSSSKKTFRIRTSLLYGDRRFDNLTIQNPTDPNTISIPLLSTNTTTSARFYHDYSTSSLSISCTRNNGTTLGLVLIRDRDNDAYGSTLLSKGVGTALVAFGYTKASELEGMQDEDPIVWRNDRFGSWLVCQRPVSGVFELRWWDVVTNRGVHSKQCAKVELVGVGFGSESHVEC